MAGYKKTKTSIIDKLLPRKGDSGVELARKIVTIVCFIVLIASLVILASYFVQQAKNKSSIDEMREQHTEASVITPATTETKTVPS
ncbi:MAG: hypothetical protein IJZ61_02640 [Oscillospiraceae bacterium]|nr:hypothetical protein [Oscillospiraceae bacterium]